MSQGYRMVIDDGDETVVFEPDDMVDVTLPLEHTTANEWRVTTPYAGRARGFELADVDFYYRDSDGVETLIYQGFLEIIEGPPDGGIQTLRGQDETAKLKRGGAARQFDQIPIHEAIQDYWDSETDWDTTVSEPTVNDVDEDLLVQSATVADEFEAVFGDIADDVPVGYDSDNDRLTALQTGFVERAETLDGGTINVSDEKYANGQAEEIGDISTRLFLRFETEYRIPADQAIVAIRGQRYDGDHDPYIDFNGERFHQGLVAGSDLEWQTFDIGEDIVPDEEHEIEIGIQFGSGRTALDVVAVLDNRFVDEFDNELNEPSGHLDRPVEYGSSSDGIVFGDEASTTFNITRGEISVATNDPDGVRNLILSFDDPSRFPLGITFESNTTSVEDLNNDSTNTLWAGFILSGYEPDGLRNETPRLGYAPQTLDNWELRVDTNDLSIIESTEIVGSHYQNLKDLHERAGYGFLPTPEASDTSVAESFQIAEETASADWRAVDDPEIEINWREYKNKITVIGKEDDDGERIKETVKNENEIGEFGEHPTVVFDASVDSKAEAISVGRSELQKRINSRRPGGTIPIVPRLYEPGKLYQVDEFGEEMVLQSLSFTDGTSPSAQLDFSSETSIESVVGGVEGDLRRTKTSI